MIFQILPALTNVLEEEWIQVETFQNASLIWSNDSLSLPMLCTSRTILDLYEKNLRPSEKSGQETVQQLEIAQVCIMYSICHKMSPYTTVSFSHCSSSVVLTVIADTKLPSAAIMHVRISELQILFG